MNILSATDRAVAAYLATEGVDALAPIYSFKRSGEKALPNVIVHSQHGVPSTHFVGAYEVDVMVVIRTNAPVDQGESETNPLAVNDALVDAVTDALHRFGTGEQSGGSLADDLTSAARGAGLTFTCQDVQLDGLEQTDGRTLGHGQFGDEWTDTVRLKLLVCGSNVS